MKKFIIMFVLTAVSIFICMLIGRFPIRIQDFLDVISGNSNNAMLNTIILEIRLPRVLFSFLAGCGLGIGGAVFQGIFRNPLATPDIVGASSGASFGAAFGIILFGINSGLIFITSFFFGCVALLLAYFINLINRNRNTSSLLIAGIIVNSLMSALLLAFELLADPRDELPSIIFWIMGNLNKIGNKDTLALFIISAICLSLLYLFRWSFDIISLGKKEARNLGMDNRILVPFILSVTVFYTSSIISLCGVIGWISLLAPHIGKLLIRKKRFKDIFIFSGMFGGIFLLFSDTLARSMFSRELPVGILTSLFGTVFFIIILVLNRSRIRAFYA